MSASAAVCAATLNDGMSVLGKGGGTVLASDCLRGGDRQLRARVGRGTWSKWWCRRPSALPLSSAHGRVRCGGRGVPRLEGARPLSCGQHTPGGGPKISRSGPARE